MRVFLFDKLIPFNLHFFNLHLVPLRQSYCLVFVAELYQTAMKLETGYFQFRLEKFGFVQSCYTNMSEISIISLFW